MSSVRTPARTTPYKRFFCNDCQCKFRARYLANRNTRSTQHFCSVYGKVVTRKVGQKSQKCQCDHDGACLIERQGGSTPGHESDDEAKANQRKNKGLTPGRPAKAAAKKKKVTNVRNGLSNGNNNSNNNSSSLNSQDKQFEGYLYSNQQSKKRFQRDDDSEEDDWQPTQDKKRRRKNKNKSKNENDSGYFEDNFNGNALNMAPVKPIAPIASDFHGHVPLPPSDDDEEEDATDMKSTQNGQQNNNGNNSNSNSNAGKNGFSEYYEPRGGNGANIITRKVPLIRPAMAPPVLPLNGNISDNDNDEKGDFENNGEGSDVGRSSDDPKTASTDDKNNNNNNNKGNSNNNSVNNGSVNSIDNGPQEKETFNEFVQIYGRACGFMRDNQFQSAIDALTNPVSNLMYLQALKSHPILSESFLIMAHANQAMDLTEQAVVCLHKIQNFEGLPTPLKIRIKETEIQLYEYSQKYGEMKEAKIDLARLQQLQSQMMLPR